MSAVGSEVTEQVGTRIMEFVIAYVPWAASLDPWVFFILMTAAAVLLSQVVGWAFKLAAKVATSRTRTRADDIFVAELQQPVAWIVFSGLLYVAVAPLELTAVYARALSHVLLVVNIIVLAYLVHRIVSASMRVWTEEFAAKTETMADDSLLPILFKFLKATVWIIAILVIIASFGVQIAPLLAGLGIAGLAIGLAVKDSLANIFGGISLAMDGAYRIGDKVKLGDGTLGTVYDITLRSTRIRTYDGDLVMVPNGMIANENIYTFAQPLPKSRVQVDFGVEYGADVDKVADVVLKEVSKLEGIEAEPATQVLFMNMGPYALEFRVYAWVEDYTKAFETKRAIMRTVYNTLQRKRIGIPFPTQTLLVKKAK